MKRVSTIAPGHNKEIRQCVDFLTQQTYSELKIAIVDNGLKDSSLLTCGRCRHRFWRFYACA